VALTARIASPGRRDPLGWFSCSKSTSSRKTQVQLVTTADASDSCRASPQPRPTNGLPSDEHNTSDFCRPLPLSRLASNVAVERAQLGPLFRDVDLLLRGEPQVPKRQVAHLGRATGKPRSPLGVRSSRSAGAKSAIARVAEVRTTS